MNPSLALLLLACIVKVVVASDDDDPNKLWEEFKANHGKQYSPKGEALRKGNFLKTHNLIKEHNKGSATFQCAHNALSDRSEEELRALCGEQDKAAAARDETLEVYSDRAAIPDQYKQKYDVREATTCVTEIQNQGECGSCWAFSSIAALEHSQCNRTGKLVKLSEQMLVDCDTNDAGCEGGYLPYAGGSWEWLKKNKKGVATLASYPYTGVQGACKYNKNSLGLKGIVAYGGPVESKVQSIQNAILTHGVVRASVYVDDNAFYFYEKGVYTSKTCTMPKQQTNHAVNLVGWATVNDTPAWIMRNSWGTSWGVAGYMYIKRGVNMCNIESKVGWVKVAV